MEMRRGRRSSVTRLASLQQLVERPVPECDQILLCCFGRDLAGFRDGKQLRLALNRAGYGAALARHLVHESPLLVREPAYRFRLRGWDE